MADIQGMFHQVRVHPDNIDFLRFLWWPDGNINLQLEEYRMKVHLFSAISSPRCANFALRRTADDKSSHYNQKVTDTIKHIFYIDDCLKSVATIKQAISLIKEVREACAKGGFRLTKWVSNSKTVLATLPDEDKAK